MDKRNIGRAVLACALVGALGSFAPTAIAGDYGHELKYTGDENEFVASGSDLFSHVENGLPGDSFEGRLLIENESDVPCEFFTATKDVVTTGPEDLLGRIDFAVTEAHDTVLFDGSLQEADGGSAISLGVVEPGGTLQADYAVSIPADLTSEYSDAQVGLNVAVSVVERAEGIGDALVSTGMSGGNKGDGSGTSLVHTGDVLTAIPFVLGVVAATGAVIWCAWKRRMRMW